MLNKMKALVREEDTCVLATVSNNKPHCSLMAYATNSEGTEIYMVTHKKTKKYRNLTENPWVSLLIDTRDRDMAVERLATKALTVTGLCETVQDRERKEEMRASLLKRHPHLEAFAADPDAGLLLIRIDSFLLLDGLTEAHFETLG
ncbi:MAG: pyridoxamine 5'-phosphate oxidase family protein [Thermodesulfobacteriota bacterium]|nr:pyridoxamine 5'-phosphate oxidase family protein [Thermodesulfobacteriota bacterium]